MTETLTRDHRAPGGPRWLRALPRWTAPAAVGAAGLAGAWLLHRVDPYEAGHYPGCPFLAVTGLSCPGCGALRGTHDLLQGDLDGALARNPALLVVLPYLALAWAAWAVRSTGRRAPRSTGLPPWVVWTVLAAVLAFGVLRNVPGWTWLSPA